MTLHGLEEDNQRKVVILVVQKRLLHGFADGLAGSEVNYALDRRMSSEDALDSSLVIAVYFVEGGADARDGFDTIEHLDIGVRQVVDTDDLIACLDELNGRVRTDVAGTASDENSSFHCLTWWGLL